MANACESGSLGWSNVNCECECEDNDLNRDTFPMEQATMHDDPMDGPGLGSFQKPRQSGFPVHPCHGAA